MSVFTISESFLVRYMFRNLGNVKIALCILKLRANLEIVCVTLVRNLDHELLTSRKWHGSS